jgi:hypothetical protein
MSFFKSEKQNITNFCKVTGHRLRISADWTGFAGTAPQATRIAFFALFALVKCTRKFMRSGFTLKKACVRIGKSPDAKETLRAGGENAWQLMAPARW